MYRLQVHVPVIRIFYVSIKLVMIYVVIRLDICKHRPDIYRDRISQKITVWMQHLVHVKAGAWILPSKGRGQPGTPPKDPCIYKIIQI